MTGKNQMLYMDFYSKCSRGVFDGYSKEQLKNEFEYYVNRHEYSKSDLDEIIEHLFNVIKH